MTPTYRKRLEEGAAFAQMQAAGSHRISVDLMRLGASAKEISDQQYAARYWAEEAHRKLSKLVNAGPKERQQ